jgi:hypothetical protein
MCDRRVLRAVSLVISASLLAAVASAQIANGTYRIINKNSGKCVDDTGAATANGTAVQQWACNGGPAQAWQLTATDSGYYKVITPANAAQGWDVTGGTSATADGVKIQLWAYGGGTNQQFQPIAETGGTYHLVARHSGKCLDVPSASTVDGTQLQQWACNGTAAQSYQVVLASGSTPTSTATATATARATATPTATAPVTTDIALGKAATSSSIEAATYPPANAVDGNTATRWSSAFSDPQWISIDLGASASVGRVRLNWEPAYAKAYTIQISTDNVNWTTIKTVTAGVGGIEDWTGLSGTGRYVRMYGTARATVYGYSLWELEVFGTFGGPTPTATTRPTATATSTATATTNAPPDFGPNVSIFDPSMSASTIQSKVDSIFSQQQSAQFGSGRFALLFKPGTYNVNVNVGFYTHVAGLGALPDNVVINGAVHSSAAWFNGNATLNFWRAAENLSVTPTGGKDTWTVSQASPYRRMHVRGGLDLADGGPPDWSSGGFISDAKIDGQVSSLTQQQWFSRTSQFGSWTGSNWNMVFVGVAGAPPQSFPNPPDTTVASAPVVREKPFLYVDGSGNYQVFVPAIRTNASGTTWGSGAPAGTSIPIGSFYIAKAGTDTAATMNNALASGKHLILTPGMYTMNDTLRVNNANTVVLGLGFPTLVASNGVTLISVADVDGVKVAGLLMDAGSTSSSVLMEVGPSGGAADHSANPTSLHDVFARIGGAALGKASVTLRVNSNNVIVDHTWLWRADHGNGVGWTSNTAANGLVVNGNNVTIYGLFVEHYQQYNVVWNGQGGRTYFFQNELPYDPPNQASWMNGTTRGFAAYKVADSVTSHEGWGLASYCFFSTNSSVVADRSFEVPVNANVKFHGLATVAIAGTGTIAHVINGTGGPSNSSSNVADVVSFP